MSSANAAGSGRRWPLLPLLWLSAAVPELVLHLATAEGPGALYSAGLPLAALFAAVPALVLFAVTAWVASPRVNFALCTAWAAFVWLLCASQLVYYGVFSAFYSAFSMANGGQVLQFWRIILTTIWRKLPLLAVMALPLAFFAVFARRFLSFAPPARRALGLVPLAAALALHLLLVAALPAFGGTAAMSAYDLYRQNSDSYYSVNRLGLLTAFRLDVQRLLTGYQPGGALDLDAAPPPDDTAPDGPAPGGSAPPDGTAPEDPDPGTEDPDETPENPDGAPPEDPPAPVYTPNVLDIDFDALIAASEGDRALQEVHQYFSQRTPSLKNDHTGLFEGCNLILITAEAFSSLIVDEARTPTLYKLMHEGIFFSDYYVPDWGTSTTDGEYAFLTGTVPKPSVWSFYRSAGNAMPLTMSRQLIARGYDAYAYHGHTYTYYHRDQYLENLGYAYKAKGRGLDVESVWPESDVEVLELSAGDYLTAERTNPFTVYYMTISGHRDFTFNDNMMSYRNRELTAEEPYSSHVRAYIACQLELEKALTLLLEKLEAAGQLENTVIVLTPDHYPNGLTVGELGELAGHPIEKNFELFRNGCVLYKAGMAPEVVDAPCSHLDLLPTLSNLFGLDFDSRLYMGRDVFSDAPPFVMFRNRSWITDRARFNAATGEVTQLTEEPVSGEYVQYWRTELDNRFAVSGRILDYDYWSLLDLEAAAPPA